MYPYELFFGLHLYDLMIVLGYLLALVYLRRHADKRGLDATVQNVCIIASAVAVIGGYGWSVVTQAFYNAMESGTFEIASDTGATFYGGLVGGAVLFVAVYFIGVRLRMGAGVASKNFPVVSDIAAGSIVIGHACGRVGCFFAGCCHGAITDAWYGIYNVGVGAKTVPVQLFEVAFLVLLALFLTRRLKKGKGNNLALYLMSYAVWRFFIEYLRADDRGETVVSFLSPSQLTAILLFLVGGVLFLLRSLSEKKKREDTRRA